jgi:Putative Ig domain
VGVGSALVLAASLVTTSVAWAAPPTTYVPVIPADLVTYPALPTAAGQFNVIDQSGGTGGGSVSLVTGPGTSQSSLQMTTTGTGSHWSVYNYDHDGTLLTNLTSLAYSSYTNDTSDTVDPGLQLVIDPGNTSGLDAGVTYSTLNFEPYVQPPSDPVVHNTWQTWNVMNGVVWGSHLTGAPITAPISWSTFLTDYPNATITGGIGLNVGSGWSAMTGNVSTLTVGTGSGTDIYEFEPVAYLQITTTSLPAASDSVAYSASLSAVGGNPPYRWSVPTRGLPKGLKLNKTTGVISGVPNKHDSGTYSFTVKVADTKVKSKHHPATQNTATEGLTITIS